MNKQKLGNPIFIIAVFILVLNDWYFKQAFSNDLTGKLSDIAGLFAFPFFLSSLFPRRAKYIYVSTFFLFVVWKSALAQPFIDNLNSLCIPVHRVVDYTDYVALFVLPFSFFCFNRQTSYHIKPVFVNVLIVISVLSFVATSMPPGSYVTFNNINKTYSFAFSKRELVSRINALQLDYVQDLNKYIQQNKTHPNDKFDHVDFDGKTNMFYYTSFASDSKKDTIARILDYETLKDNDTISLKTTFANISISGDDNNSQLKLLSTRRYVPRSEKSDHQLKSVKFFEKMAIDKLK